MTPLETWGEPTGQGWLQIGELAIAWLLSALIGFERELKQKAAGVRTYTVVGFGAALFMLVSKYGFTDVLISSRVVLDPSRVAAQIVSGLGFIGGGIIFVKRDSVRGLTTAASIWLTAAIGAAAGAGLPVLALVGTGIYFVTILGLRPAARIVGRRFGNTLPTVQVEYLDGRGLLRDILGVVTDSGFLVADVSTTRNDRFSQDADDDTDRGGAQRSHSGTEQLIDSGDDRGTSHPRSVQVRVRLDGRGDLGSLVTALATIQGVLEVSSLDEDDEAI